MKRLFALAVVAGAFAVAACDNSSPYEDDNQDMAVEAPMAPAPEDAAVPTDATAPAAPPPTDSTSHPAEKKTSEESVQPESETLFY